MPLRQLPLKNDAHSLPLLPTTKPLITKTSTPTLALLAALGGSLASGGAFADDLCSVAEADRQLLEALEALEQKLVAEGRGVKRMKVDDGCYEAYATNAEGSASRGLLRSDHLRDDQERSRLMGAVTARSNEATVAVRGLAVRLFH